MIIGYARVSTPDQALESQLNALEVAGCERIFAEKVSGGRRHRPELDRMLDQLRADDVIVVQRYDRLARSLADLLAIVSKIREGGAGFRSLAEAVDTTTPAGQLVFHVFASIAEFERARIRERTLEGLKAARLRGRVGGRPRALTSEQSAKLERWFDHRGHTTAERAGVYCVSPETIEGTCDMAALQAIFMRSVNDAGATTGT